MAGKIFINYRRDDSMGMAGRLHDRLAHSFGRDKLFMDVDNIPVGADFVAHLNSQVAGCDVMLVVIGPNWLGAKDEAGQRRLHQPDDFVAIEIAAALARDIRVIPVLVDGARMPKASELPDSLNLLARRQAAEVRHSHFGQDAETLVARMRKALGGGGSAGLRPWRRMAMAAAAVAVLLLVGWGGYAVLIQTIEHALQQREAELNAEQERQAKAVAEAEAKRKVEEAEQQKAKAAAEADAQRRAEQRWAAAEVEQRRAAAEAEQRRAAAEVEQSRAARRDQQGVPLSPERERALKPKDAFHECATCPEMVVVPAGSFTMGSPTSEVLRESNESPQHAVTLARQFAVGRFAVTFDEWDACAADGGCSGNYKPSDQGWGRGRRPVIYVSWDDAKEYAAWLSRKTGKTYRLLSEAEREYVTRAGTTTPFWWGSSISTSQANYNASYYTYGGGAKGEFRQKTLPVDSFQPNPWGLYQVHGNVREWVEDCWNESYRGAPSDGSAWTSGDCSHRVDRGGSWRLDPQFLRSAYRNGTSAGGRFIGRGFRVGRTLTP